MKTLGIIAGVVGLGALFWYLNQRRLASDVVSRVPTPTTGDKLHAFTNQVADFFGGTVAKATGLGGVAQPIKSAARSYVNGTITAVKQTGTGLQQIGQGNILIGGKNVALGAAESAYTATGAKGVVDFTKSLF